MLALAGIDAVPSTSLFKQALDWFATVKLTALGAGMVWSLFILAPAALFARVFDTWADGIFTKQLVRPIVGPLTFYWAALVGVQVWDHLPRIEKGPPEFAVPGPEIYRAELAIIELHLMALNCMKDRK